MEQKMLRKYAKVKNNVLLMDIICFEYILLEFTNLISWIYSTDDEYLIKRRKVVVAREKFVNTIQNGEMNYKDIREIVEYNGNVDNYNVEQLSSRIGDCWIKSCCEWEKRMPDDICGLDINRLSIREKMRQIYEGTSLFTQFQNIGLEVVL